MSVRVARGPFSGPGSVQSSFFAIPVGDCPRLRGQSPVTVSRFQAGNGGRGHGEGRPMYKGGDQSDTCYFSHPAGRISATEGHPAATSLVSPPFRLLEETSSTGGLKQQVFTSRSSGGLTSKIKAPAESRSGEVPLPGSQMAGF